MVTCRTTTACIGSEQLKAFFASAAGQDKQRSAACSPRSYLQMSGLQVGWLTSGTNSSPRREVRKMGVSMRRHRIAVNRKFRRKAKKLASLYEAILIDASYCQPRKYARRESNPQPTVPKTVAANTQLLESSDLTSPLQIDLASCL